MTERRGSRFLLEVLFLVALATALTLTHLHAVEIAAGMLIGWVIVAGIEWAAWRSEPHYGSGLPPRYYVPSVHLPPAQPLEQVAVDGYPEATRDEAPTWIASAALRSELLGEWPVAAPIFDDEPAPELVAADEEPEVEPVRLPPVTTVEPSPEPEPDPAPEPEPEPEPVPGTAEAVPGTSPEPEPEPALDVALTASAQHVARYTLDPLAEPAPKRRFGRGGGGSAPEAVEVPARPAGARALPGRSGRQD
jgi:outer membrane biosynthesis protein TonB